MSKELFVFRTDNKEEIWKLLNHIKDRERYTFGEIILQALKMRKEMLKLKITN